MTQKVNVNGSCLCGSVKITALAANPNIGVCHCSMCRKWAGGPLLTIDCESQVLFDGEEYISSYSSSDWAERGFCSQCGSNLFYRLKQNNQYIVPVGLFEVKGAFRLDHQVFIDDKPTYYCFSNKTKDMTGAEVFAQYDANEE